MAVYEQGRPQGAGPLHGLPLHVAPSYCRRYVEAVAPNTDVLRDPATGKMKELVKLLMFGTLPKSESEVAACYVKMEELGIVPHQRRGGAFAPVDGFPPSPAMRKLAETYFHDWSGGDGGWTASMRGGDGGGGTTPMMRAAGGRVASVPLSRSSAGPPCTPFRPSLPPLRHAAMRLPAVRPITWRLR